MTSELKGLKFQLENVSSLLDQYNDLKNKTTMASPKSNMKIQAQIDETEHMLEQMYIELK